MKKIMAVMLSLLACTVLLAGCNTSSESNEEQSLKVYSFSGENEYISVSNGVIILDGKDEICYGGDLKVMSDDFANITTYSTTIYINGSEKETLLSNGVDDQTGETIDVSGNVGQISGDILRDSDADKLTDNLWFELKTTNLNGEESTYRVQLETGETGIQGGYGLTKIRIIGCSGSGKTYLANALSKKYNIFHFGLDEWFNGITTLKNMAKRERLMSKFVITRNII